MSIVKNLAYLCRQSTNTAANVSFSCATTPGQFACAPVHRPHALTTCIKRRKNKITTQRSSATRFASFDETKYNVRKR